MKKEIIFLLIFFVFVAALPAYKYLIGDNVFIHIVNFSKTENVNIWTKSSRGDIVTACSDSISGVNTFNEEEVVSVRTKMNSEFELWVKINEEAAVSKRVQIESFEFVYVIIQSGTHRLDSPRVEIIPYTLKEAWDMNLIFGSE